MQNYLAALDHSLREFHGSLSFLGACVQGLLADPAAAIEPMELCQYLYAVQTYIHERNV